MLICIQVSCTLVVIVNISYLQPFAFTAVCSLRRLSYNVSLSMFVFIAGCFGDPVILTGTDGIISINSTQYQNWMACSWTIRVGPNEVSSNVGVMVITYWQLQRWSLQYDSGQLNISIMLCRVVFLGDTPQLHPTANLVVNGDVIILMGRGGQMSKILLNGC